MSVSSAADDEQRRASAAASLQEGQYLTFEIFILITLLVYEIRIIKLSMSHLNLLFFCADPWGTLAMDQYQPEIIRDPGSGKIKKQFKCPACPKIMQSMWKLKRHLSSHTGHKPFR